MAPSRITGGGNSAPDGAPAPVRDEASEIHGRPVMPSESPQQAWHKRRVRGRAKADPKAAASPLVKGRADAPATGAAVSAPCTNAGASPRAGPPRAFLDINAGPAMGAKDAAGLVADIAGIFDPTPLCDGISGAISLSDGDLPGAGLSVASMIPYVGDAAAKPVKIARRVVDAFPSLARLFKSASGVPALLRTLEALGPGLKSGTRVAETLRALNNMHDAAEGAYRNTKWLERVKKLRLPTDGPIPFVPPKRWNTKNPLRTSDRRGFVDAFGNEWRPGPSRTSGDAFEWDVIPTRNSPLRHLSRDGSHINVSLEGVVTHR